MPFFNIAPCFNGDLTPKDLLSSEGTFEFVILKKADLTEGILFQLIDQGFIFSYGIQNQSLVLQRNDIVSILTLEDIPENTMLIFYAIWPISKLTLICNYDHNLQKIAELNTKPVMPPNSLIVWARKNDLLPIEDYNNEEEFRTKVHSILQSVQDKISNAGAYEQFWNNTYEGKKLIKKEPKREIWQLLAEIL